jgi:hypothetical protein
MDTQLLVAVIAGSVALVGHALANILGRWRDVRLKVLEFKLQRYQDFLSAACELMVRPAFESQFRFANTLNVINLMGGKSVLLEVEKLVENYNNEKWSAKKQDKIINQIIACMRSDLGSSLDGLEAFKFPFIVPDIPPSEPRPRERHHE